MRRLLLALVLVASTFVPVGPSGAQSAQEMEISSDCLAVGQRIPDLTVWGSGWGAYFNNGARLQLEWHWGGEPTTPRPATVTPPTQAVTSGSFTLVFDATGISPAFTSFSLIWIGATGQRTLVGTEDLDVQNTCPTGRTTCTADTAGRPVLGAEVRGYPTSWQHQFFYQFRRPGQVGPVAGALGSDGVMRAEFHNLAQVANATVTARVIEPPGQDRAAIPHYTTFAAPICNPPPTTTTNTTTTTSTPGSTTITTSPPDDTVPDDTTTTTRPPVDIPGTPVTVPPTIDLPPPTPGATLTVTPELGPAGFVTSAAGTGFPPGAVTLVWSPGIGSTTAIVGPDGTFAARVLVFPNDRLGPRALVAVAGGTSAYDAFLVVPSSVQPSGQDVRQINRIRRFNQR